MHLWEIATELFFSWLLPMSVIVGLCGLMLAVAGCSTSSDGSKSLDLSVRGSYNPGSASGTRNQTPQGGTDEKSESTPTEPAY